MKTALTIAGSDSCGGAGIQADIKTMTMNGVYAMSAVTALTAQNTTGVTGIMEASPAFLAEQITDIFEDIRPDAVKIGMVSSSGLIEVIAERLYAYHGHYLMPAVMSQQPTSKGDGTATFEKDSSIRFPSLNTPNDPNVTVFPLFTDWTELYKWQGAPKNTSGKIDTIIFSFQDIAALIKDSPMSDGFVLNPFSENRFWFDRKLVNNIVNSEGYQKEFGEGKETSNIEEVHVAKDTKVMLGIPAESDEVK